jgi:hypothetical protein
MHPQFEMIIIMHKMCNSSQIKRSVNNRQAGIPSNETDNGPHRLVTKRTFFECCHLTKFSG